VEQRATRRRRRRRTTYTMKGLIRLLLLVVSATTTSAQQYNDYPNDGGGGGGYGGGEQDNLYADYAMKQQEKIEGGGGGGMGGFKLAVLGTTSWIVGARVHSKRATRTLKKKHMKETKTLYSQYYNDVYKLQEQNAEMAYAVEQLQSAIQKLEQDREMEKIQRDYDEFKQPDIDGDDRISRAEFAMYVKNYLANYPGLAEKDYPMFEDFDHDKDGFVSFQEYAQQMSLQVKQAEAEAKRVAAMGGNNGAANAKAQALRGLSGETKMADGFNDLYAKYRVN